MSTRPARQSATTRRVQPPRIRVPKLETGSYTLSGGTIKTDPDSSSAGPRLEPASRPVAASIKAELADPLAGVKRERACSPVPILPPPCSTTASRPDKPLSGRHKVVKSRASGAGRLAARSVKREVVTIDLTQPDVMTTLTGEAEPTVSFKFERGEYEYDAMASSSALAEEKPKAKRAKKSAGQTKEKHKEPEEKRLHRARTKAPVAVLERLDRVRSQRMYLVDRERHPDGWFEVFTVLGSTGNVYTVTIALTPSCDCPDGEKNGTCKHVIFVMLKVLHTPETGNYWFQRSLLSTELAELFANAPPSPQQSALAAGTVRSSYRTALGCEPEADPFANAKGTGGLPEKKPPDEGDDCPVCYDEFKTGVSSLHYCLVGGGCGKAIHDDCAQQWTQAKRKNGEEVTCVWCRASWAALAAARAPARSATVNEGYLNLGGVAGLSDKRDTSSYYHGPRRGERYSWHSLSSRYR